MRIIELDEDLQHIRICFAYSRELVDVVRGLPQRRYDPQTKHWRVPLEHVEDVLGTLSLFDFDISNDLQQWLEDQGQSLDAVLDTYGSESLQPFVDPSILPSDTLTVSELNHQVRKLLKEYFSGEVWLVGELQGYERTPQGRHAFFELIERPFKGADPSARISMALFAEDRARLEAHLDRVSPETRLRDGLLVRLKGRLDLYTAQGRFQCLVTDIDPVFTAGAIYQNRERILRQLEVAGMLTLNVDRPWPSCPLRIGLITSYESDAYNDFVHELGRSGLAFEVTVFHVQVQGAQTEASVLRALQYFESRKDAFDAVAIVRGGGSRSDLSYFDTKALGEAVCNLSLKVICGIGHHRDTCLIDFIAESEKTPTSAAQFFVRRVSEYLVDLEQKYLRLCLKVRDRVDAHQEVVEKGARKMERLVEERVQAAHHRLQRQGFRLEQGVNITLRSERAALVRLSCDIPQAALRRLDHDQQALRYAGTTLTYRRLNRRLREAKDALDNQQSRLERVLKRCFEGSRLAVQRYADQLRLLDPQRILERGYALVYRVDRGSAHASESLDSVSKVHVGEAITLRWHDGSAHATIDQINDPISAQGPINTHGPGPFILSDMGDSDDEPAT